VLTFPIKKWSALAALVAAAFYLLLSGAEVATQRSFLMTAVVLIAVIVDRRAITFRTLAVAAIVVLMIAPEALVHPSFQMSFAARWSCWCSSACRICSQPLTAQPRRG
jgi:competence protein ComEC